MVSCGARAPPALVTLVGAPWLGRGRSEVPWHVRGAPSHRRHRQRQRPAAARHPDGIGLGKRPGVERPHRADVAVESGSVVEAAMAADGAR
jgi:hypothetical protein